MRRTQVFPYIILAFFASFFKQFFFVLRGRALACMCVCQRLCVCYICRIHFNAIRCLNCVINLKCVSVNFPLRKCVRFDCKIEEEARGARSGYNPNEYHFRCEIAGYTDGAVAHQIIHFTSRNGWFFYLSQPSQTHTFRLRWKCQPNCNKMFQHLSLWIFHLLHENTVACTNQQLRSLYFPTTPTPKSPQ